MSQAVRNILYVGHNIQLAKTMLNLSAPVSTKPSYYIHQLTSTHDIQFALTERKYSDLICELPIRDALTVEIADDYPLLKTSYINPPKTAEEVSLAAAMEGLVSDEVKTTLDYLSIPIYFKNKTGQYIACNSYFSHLFGLTPAQVIGKTSADILPADRSETIEEIDQKIFTEQKVFFAEFKFHNHLGEERDMVFRKEAVANRSIQIGMIFDVTDINEAKRSLEKERIMLRATADISADLIFFKDLEGQFLGCNKQFEIFTGCSEKNMVGKKDEQICCLNQWSMFKGKDHKAMLDKQVYYAEEYLTNKDGERHLIEMKKVPLLDDNGNVQGLIGVGRDITEHHQLQKQLKVANAVFENSNEDLLVTDETGHIISANKLCCADAGYSKEELLNSDLSIFSVSQQAEIDAALQENKAWQGEVNYLVKNGDRHYGWLELYAIEHPEKEGFSYVFSMTNFTQTLDKRAEAKVQFFAKHDPLTGLFNRIALFNRLEDAIARANHKQTSVAVILVDIDGFKALNECYGNIAGDEILKVIADRIKSCVAVKDTVARFGDDEFVIIVDELQYEQDVSVLAQRITEQFNKEFLINNSAISLTATIGISLCPDDGMDGDTLLRNANKARLRGKARKNSGDSLPSSVEKERRRKKSCSSAPYHFYTRKLTHYSRQQIKLESELKKALQLNQFELYYQPQFDLNKRRIVAVEGVLHWNHPRQGVLSPDNFLNLPDNNRLLVDLGLHALRKAAMQARIWQDSSIKFGRIAVDLSKAQLLENRFIADLQTILLETKCSNQWLELIIDEVIFRSDSPVIYNNLVNIAKMGVALTVANFAEDRPILYLFEELGIEKFKMSRSYTETPPNHFVGSALKDAVFTLSRSLGIDVVAESLGNIGNDMYSNTNNPSVRIGQANNHLMKASEATFYLRCNKRK